MKALKIILLISLSFSLLVKGQDNNSDTISISQPDVVKLSPEELAWIKAHPEITLGFTPDLAPAVIQGENGELSGYLVDIYKELEAMTGLKVKIDLDEWTSAVRKASDGETDGLLVAVPELIRNTHLTPTRIMTRVVPVIFARDDSPFTIDSRKDLEGKKIAVPKGSHLVYEYLGPLMNTPDVVEVQSGLELMKMVFEGKVDAVVGLNLHSYYIDRYILLNVSPVLLVQEYQSVSVAGIRSDWPELVSIMNKVLDAIGPNRLIAIQKEWTQLDISMSVIDAGPPFITTETLSDQLTLFIKWIAGVFAILLLIMFGYWMAEGRPKQFSIKLTILLSGTMFVGLVVTTGVLIIIHLQGEQRREEIEKRKYESLKLAYELKQSSDDLTRFARTFSVTGDPRHEEYFHAIIRIRDGKQAHPAGFSPVFWDQVSAGLLEYNEDGETYNISERMISLGLSEREKEKLTKAKFESDKLIELEEVAIHTFKGYYKDKEGEFTLKGKPSQEMARELLHGEEYHAAKANIMTPVNDFIVLLEKRTENELQIERSRNKAILLAITGFILLTIFFSIFIYLLARKRIAKPLKVLEVGVLKIESGDYSHQINMNSQDEIGDLGRTFNAMSQSVNDRNQQLKESEERFRGIIEKAQTGYFFIDEQGIFRQVNKAWLDMHKFSTSEEIIGQHFSATQVENDLDAAQEIVDGLIRENQSLAGEFSRRCKDGSIGYHQFTVKPVIKEGLVIGLEGFLIDTTQQKVAKEVMEKTHQMLRMAEEIGEVGSWEWDVQSNKVTYSDNALKLYGIKPEEYDGKMESVFNVFHPEDRLMVQKSLGDAIAEKKPMPLEYRIVKPDGEIRIISASSQMFFNDNGDVFKLVGHIQDITDLRKNEQELKLSKDEVESIKLRLERAFEATEDGVWEWNMVTNENFVSPRWLEILGISQDNPEVPMDYQAWTKRVHPDDVDRVMNTFNDHMEKGITYDVDYRYLNESQEYRWQNGRAKLFRDDNGKPISMVGSVRDITEQKKAEQKLQDAQNRLKIALSSSKMFLWEYRVKDDLISADNLMLEVFGLPLDQATDLQSIVEKIHPDDVVKATAIMSDALTREMDYINEYRIIPKEGQVRWIDGRGRSYLDEKDNVSHVIGIGMDITEKKKAEEELKNANLRLTIALSSSKMGSWEYSIKNNKVTADNMLLEIYGLPLDQKVELSHTIERIHPEDREGAVEAINHALSEPTEYHSEYRVIPREGDIHWLDVRGKSFIDDDGKVSHVIGIATDITERKKAEQELKNARLRLNHALSSSKMGSWEYHLKNDRMMPDKTVREIYGLPLDRPVNLSEVIEKMHPETRGESMKVISDALSRKTDFYDIQKVIPEEGVIRWVEGRGRSYLDANGNVSYVIGIAVDITERKLAEFELEKAKKQAETANRAKSMFLANMSHEIRTPMNAILGHSQIMRRDKSLNSEQLESIKSINKSGQHLLNLINDILDMSKIEAGKIKILPVSFYLHSLLNDTIEMFHMQVKAKGLNIKIELDSSLPDLIYTDEKRIRQVVINLLSNAVKFTDAGEIKLTAKKNNGLIHISISDTGIGLKKEELENIFRAFEQSDSGMHTSGGTGLGLSISRNFAQLMGGNITVESAPGKGSEFSFSFKYEDGKKEEVQEFSPQNIVIGLKPGQAEARVLIADDNKENRDVAKKLLKPLGFKIKEVKNGKEAIELAEEWNPMVILMDIVMPVMGGVEASRKIKTTDWGKDITIIAISASAVDEDRASILKQGADSYVSKPFNESNLLEEIKRHSGIEYEYEDVKVADSKLILPEDIKGKTDALSDSLKERFISASVTGDVNRIMELNDEVSKTDKELADYIQQLAEDLEIEKIKKLFDKD